VTALIAAFKAICRAFLPALAYLLMLLIGLGAGWELRNLEATRDQAQMTVDQGNRINELKTAADDKLKAANDALRDLKIAMQAAVDKALADGDQATADLALELQLAHEKTRKLNKELRDAKARADAAGRPVCNLSNEWVRLYNTPLQAGGGDRYQAQAGGSPGATGGAANPAFAQQNSGLNEWDVSDLHAENARRWNACRSQLNTLIDLEQGAH
jgi:hypothetical protein